MKNKKYGPDRFRTTSTVVRIRHRRIARRRGTRRPRSSDRTRRNSRPVDGDNRQDAIARIAMAALESTVHEDASFKAMATAQMVGPKNDHNEPIRRASPATNGAIRSQSGSSPSCATRAANARCHENRARKQDGSCHDTPKRSTRSRGSLRRSSPDQRCRDRDDPQGAAAHHEHHGDLFRANREIHVNVDDAFYPKTVTERLLRQTRVRKAERLHSEFTARVTGAYHGA